MSKPVIAIVGRPNVGKSTLFNKLAGERISIVEDTPGVTRDRIYYEIEWNGRAMILVDTGGIEPRSDDIILRQMKTQAQIAVETADVIVFMVDVTTGLTAADRDIATMLIKSQKPLILAVNKCDSVGNPPMEFYEFYELGIDGEPIQLSSVHGTGSGDLLDRVLELCPADEEKEDDSDIIKVAVIGKPNAGKSSIINKILGEERLIVSDIPAPHATRWIQESKTSSANMCLSTPQVCAVSQRWRTGSRNSRCFAPRWRLSVRMCALS